MLLSIVVMVRHLLSFHINSVVVFCLSWGILGVSVVWQLEDSPATTEAASLNLCLSASGWKVGSYLLISGGL